MDMQNFIFRNKRGKDDKYNKNLKVEQKLISLLQTDFVLAEQHRGSSGDVIDKAPAEC